MKKTRIIPNKKELVILSLLLGLAFFTHFYKLFDYFNLTGDPGRDALVVRDIIVNKKLTLIGPKASAGGFYYGPWYFYLLVPVFLLTGLDPIAAPLFSSTVNVITVILLYFVAKELFNKRIAFITTLLYTTSPFVLEQARRGWNPSLLPIFSLLCFYFFYKFLISRKPKYLIWWGLSFGAGLQFHFALLFSLPIYLGLFLLRHDKAKTSVNLFLLGLLAGLGILVFFLPIFLFELRHNFITIKGFVNFLRFGVERGVTYHPGISVGYYLSLIYQSLISTVMMGSYKNYFILALMIIFILMILLVRKKLLSEQSAVYLLLVYFGSLLGLALYKGPVHPYYWIFILPLPFILIGYLLGKLGGLGRLGKILSLILFFLIFWQNLKLAPFWQKPKRTIKEEKETAKVIADDAKNLDERIKINVVMFSPLDAAHSAFEYRYLIEYYGKEVLPAEDYRGAEKLYIVAEQKIDDPISQPVMEIRDFGAKRVEKEWETEAKYKIYRLGK